MAREVERDERMVATVALGERLSALRLRDAESLRRMQQPLTRQGQLTPLVVYRTAAEQLEVVDGFKRLHAARALGHAELQVQVLPATAVQAKLALRTLNAGRGLSELEEAWLVRSLYREDELTQPAIGHLLGRHKSWVSRRLLLAEGLDETVQADVRLGLLAARTAIALARLPRRNQGAVATVVARRGLTTHQAERLVTEILACPDEAARQRRLEQEQVGRAAPDRPAATPTRRERSRAEWLLVDIGTMTRLSARLQARLLEQPLSALGRPAAALVSAALRALTPVLDALQTTVAHVVPEEEPHGSVARARAAGP